MNDETMDESFDDFATISFCELQRLGDDELTQYVSLKSAINVCKNSLVSSEVTGDEVFHFWVHKLIKIYDSTSFNVMEWQHLAKLFLECVKQLAEADFQKLDTTPAFETFFSDALELLKCLQLQNAPQDIKKMCTLLEFALQSVGQFLAFYRKCPSDDDYQRALQYALELHTFVLQVLNKVIEVFIIKQPDEFTKLTKLLDILCAIGENSKPIEFMQNIENWKCVTKLTAHCAKYLDAVSEDNVITAAALATRPINYLLSESKRSLNVIYKEETFRQPLEHVQKYMRISNFFLKLLQRLTDIFRHEYFPCSKDFLKVFVLAKNPPTFLKNSKINVLFEKYVQTVLCDIFAIIHQNSYISEYISRNACCDNSKEFNVIIKEFMRASLVAKDQNYINDSADVFIKIFQHLLSESNSYCDANVYNATVEVFAALSILNSSGKLKKYFRLTVLKESCLLAQTSADVLLTIAHSSNSCKKDHILNFRFWCKCNHQFSMFTANPRVLLVKMMLLHYYKLGHEERLSIDINDLKSKSFQSVYYRSIVALGLRNFEGSSIISYFLTESLKQINLLSSTCSVESYYQMLMILKCLATQDQPIDKETQLSNLSLLTKILNIYLATEIQSFSRLLASILNLSSNHLNLLDEEEIVNMIKLLKWHADKLDESVLPALLTFVRKACQKINSKQSSDALLNEFTRNTIGMPVVKVLAAFCLKSNCQSLKNCKTNAETYGQIILRPLNKHVCFQEKSYHNQEFKAKRARINGKNFAEDLLNDMLEKSQRLLKLDGKLKEHELNIVNNVVSNLKSCLIKQDVAD